MTRFWYWLKHFAQRRLGETPNSLRWRQYEITVNWNEEICARDVSDPMRHNYVVGRLWQWD
jgi:hypothetical protein